MSHETFYRKYRSQSFKEIVGQQHIVQTLSNAITLDRLAQAYIFSGPRGTGKTSTARILAKSLNCRSGKSPAPCLTCDLCKKITSGHAVDVIEIDAASHTGVDNIRVLNEQINFTPVECLYKLFIIDEVHMLSTGAFNALLKTLEEPPSNTIFVLATTEPHKIPATIHSRCQHLTFKKLSVTELTSQLRHISDQESITIDDDSLKMIARNASGGMRDAISLLDQAYSFKGNTLTLTDVRQLLGTTGFEQLKDLLTSFIRKDTAQVIPLLHQHLDDGINPSKLVSDFCDSLKSLLFLKLGVKEGLDLDEGQLQILKPLAKDTSIPELEAWLELFGKLEMELRWFPNPSLLLDIRFVSALHTQATTTVTAPPPAPTQTTHTPSAPTPRPTPSTPITPTAMPSRPTPPPTPAHKVDPTPQKAAAPSQPAITDPLWPEVITRIQKEKPGLYFILNGSYVTELSDTSITIQLKQNFKFAKEKLKERENITVLTKIIHTLYKKELTIKVDTTVLFQNQHHPSQPAAEEDIEAPSAQAPAEVDANSKKINMIVSMFEGNIL